MTNSKRGAPRGCAKLLLTALLLLGFGACGGDDEPGPVAQGTAMNPGVDSGTGGGGKAGTPGTGGSTIGSAGNSATPGTGGVAAPSTGGTTGAAAGSGGMLAGGSGGSTVLPSTCAEVAAPYTVSATTLDASIVAASVGNFWGGAGEPATRAMVAVDPTTNKVYVGITQMDGSSFKAVIAAEGSAAAEAIAIPGAILGGLAVTNDGLGALIYDPNSAVDMRQWAAVKRLSFAGDEKFSTDMFRSSNLDDDMTKGNPARGRLGYIAASDQLVAYFGHMQMLQGVRHQGGYLATLDASGTKKELSGWFGSHNLDQRLVIDGDKAAVFSLGDAYPEGFFFSFITMAKTNVVYDVAVSGDGAANGQVGGLLAFPDALVASFVTDKSIAQDVNAGVWPDIDSTISMQIREAQANGHDVGLLTIPKTGTPSALTPVWADVQPTAGARMTNVKSVQYGDGDLILIAWTELAGSQFAPTSTFYTAVVDRTGAVCQPKQMLEAANGFGYDDMVRRSDGSVVWANASGGQVHVVTLIP